jgi:transglutaminase-like putative cysteine protease
VFYQVSHHTKYTYNQLVFLNPHVLRLYPRSDAWQKLQDFSLKVEPLPEGISQFIDLDGNNLIKLWFTQPTTALEIEVKFTLETLKSNPFDYLLEPEALNLPLDYSHSLLSQLSPYLASYSPTPDPVAIALAQEILANVNGNTIEFLMTLNNNIYKYCNYLTRETGYPWPPGVTWQKKQGSCRDFSVLFLEVCRAMGLAARFVSGYQEGDPNQEERDLHAWAEVYLPGGGWRGYDPTHGLAVSDRHIALVASAIPSFTAPIVGTVTPVKSPLETGLEIKSQLRANIFLEKN